MGFGMMKCFRPWFGCFLASTALFAFAAEPQGIAARPNRLEVAPGEDLVAVRGRCWWAAFLQNEENYNIPTKLTKVVDIREPPYTTRYPELIGFLDPHPDEVRWNAAWDNAFIDCNPLDLVRGRWATNETDVVISGNPGFVDRARGDYRLRADSQIYDRIPGFRTIPFEKMGLLTSKGIR